MQNKLMSRFAVALTAVLLAACASSPTAQSTGEYLDDAAITAKVKSAFIRDKDVRVNDFKVETFKGTVQLSGFASSPKEIDRAVQITRYVPGVKLVLNDIHLKPPAPVGSRADQTPTSHVGPESGNDMAPTPQTNLQSEPIETQRRY